MTLGLAVTELDQILDTVNCLQLLGHSILITSGSELRQFTAFSTWMHQEIDIQALDPLSVTAEESADKDVVLDHAQTFEYIQGALLQSQIIELFGMQAPSDSRLPQEIGENGNPIYDEYKKDLNTFLKGLLPEKKLPALDSLISRLRCQCQVVFNRIAETQKRKVRFGDSIVLGEGDANHVDARMIVEVESFFHGESPLLTTPKDSPNRLEDCTSYIATVMKNNERNGRTTIYNTRPGG